ncbi:hypothetical protein FC62_GL000002 [Amylolactobacillus amylotrophicus DSM 20534]|uniref:acylphosphatase n=3 Tax=Amylolactobacillus TaxID=2767876 RepID=A0A0R1YVC6_9LACO|nr:MULTISPECIES: acylphosphatase [Amylolactobacillus]APT17967.1 acylphosphatase [Amylolactobacillus amylophilus DSM 20533 = JCM 1125]KRK38321.1 hypothetical protein FC62_GL000002 [Amylolactobacillus amylotrophicus DSM 20534]KRM43036.1 hypothetical protein FD40_GL000837 [Amylolactobacillus amylophilus DSM 20533 = JCM 1125]GED79906.1 acylphosphatase [Amylolactobacillus amylophilus]
MITNEIIVHGLVQGVGFRFMTKLVADQLHVFGTVENLANGDVRIVAQADSETMTHFLTKIKASPSPSGHVETMQVRELTDVQPLHSFRVTG